MSACVPSVRTSLDRRGMIALIACAHRSIGQRLGPDLYATPAWDMLLDLYADDQRRQMSLTSLCLSSNTSERTALRTIDGLVRQGLLTRTPDTRDRRRTNIQLSPRAIRLLNGHFDDLLKHLRKI